MPLYRPTELVPFLASIGHRPKRTLSQNFLIDGNIVAKIIAEGLAASPSLVVEIGPGPGVLTEALLERDVQVIAIEKDDEFARALPRLDPTGAKLRVLSSDFFDCSLEALVKGYDPKEVLILSNLPYHLTSPLLHSLLESSHLFSTAVLMMQEEVARKITGGKPSFLSCCVEFFTEAKLAFFVPKNCFWPRPKVDSAVVTLHVHSPPLIQEWQKPFFEMVQRAFAGRRKTVLHSLLKSFPREVLTSAFDQIGVQVSVRPEELPFSTWIALFRQLLNKRGVL